MDSHNVLNNFTKHLQFFNGNATINLLTCSILVSISGALRVYLASILLMTSVDIMTCFASGLIIYSVYTLDRTLDSEEDVINRSELAGSKKEIGLMVTVLSFLWGAYLFSKRGLLGFAFLPFITGFLYSKGIKIGKYSLRLKGGLGVKNIAVGITWGLCTVGVAAFHCDNPLAYLSVFIMYGVKTFTNSVLDDFKDIKGDCLAGIKTLPVCFGKKRTRDVLLGFHLISHSLVYAALVCGYIAFEPVIIGGSFICGFLCILSYTNEKIHMPKNVLITCLKDGESVILTLIKIIGSVS